MNRIVTFIVSLFCASQVHAQSVASVTEDFGVYREVYHMDAATRLKQGPYVRLHQLRNDTLAEGQYKGNQKIGPWKYYGSDGKLLLSYDYDQGAVAVHSSCAAEEISIPLLTPEGLTSGLVESPPLYLGYEEELHHILDEHLDVPESIYREGLCGVSLVSFTVDREGRMKDAKVDRVLHPDLRPRLLKALEHLDSRWIPAQKDGGAIASRVTVVVDIQFFNQRPSKPLSDYVEQPGVFVIEKFFVREQGAIKGK